MTIEVKYFASLRDRLGRAGDRLEAMDGLTVAGVWAALWPGVPGCRRRARTPLSVPVWVPSAARF